mmetsp:Transcript_13439/g.43710  ORF Transcript_13439/g.43710 Transcript_13439/m.43710 type:complete len:906 (+) Transcript_13439:535-3252(+)
MLPGRLVQHKGLLQPGQRLPRRGALAARQARPHRLCAGGVALRARRGRGAAHVQRRGLQRDEGRLLEPGPAPLPRPQKGALPRPPDLRDRLGRRPALHPDADVRRVRRLPPPVLPPLQRKDLRVRRRGRAAHRRAPRAARVVARRVRLLARRRRRADPVAARRAGAVRGVRAVPRRRGRGCRADAVCHPRVALPTQPARAVQEAGLGRAQRLAPWQAERGAAAATARLQAGLRRRRRRVRRVAAAGRLLRRPQGRGSRRRGEGAGVGSHPRDARLDRRERLRAVGGRGVDEHDRVPAARGVRLADEGPLLHDGRPLRVGVWARPDRAPPLRGGARLAQGGRRAEGRRGLRRAPARVGAREPPPLHALSRPRAAARRLAAGGRGAGAERRARAAQRRRAQGARGGDARAAGGAGRAGRPRRPRQAAHPVDVRLDGVHKVHPDRGGRGGGGGGRARHPPHPRAAHRRARVPQRRLRPRSPAHRRRAIRAAPLQDDVRARHRHPRRDCLLAHGQRSDGLARRLDDDVRQAEAGRRRRVTRRGGGDADAERQGCGRQGAAAVRPGGGHAGEYAARQRRARRRDAQAVPRPRRGGGRLVGQLVRLRGPRGALLALRLGRRDAGRRLAAPHPPRRARAGAGRLAGPPRAARADAVCAPLGRRRGRQLVRRRAVPRDDGRARAAPARAAPLGGGAERRRLGVVGGGRARAVARGAAGADAGELRRQGAPHLPAGREDLRLNFGGVALSAHGLPVEHGARPGRRVRLQPGLQPPRRAGDLQLLPRPEPRSHARGLRRHRRLSAQQPSRAKRAVQGHHRSGGRARRAAVGRRARRHLDGAPFARRDGGGAADLARRSARHDRRGFCRVRRPDRRGGRPRVGRGRRVRERNRRGERGAARGGKAAGEGGALILVV